MTKLSTLMEAQKLTVPALCRAAKIHAPDAYQIRKGREGRRPAKYAAHRCRSPGCRGRAVRQGRMAAVGRGVEAMNATETPPADLVAALARYVETSRQQMQAMQEQTAALVAAMNTQAAELARAAQGAGEALPSAPDREARLHAGRGVSVPRDRPTTLWPG